MEVQYSSDVVLHINNTEQMAAGAGKEGSVGGIMVMPLRKNVPLPKEPDWKLEICMECGQECWDSRLPPGHTAERKMCEECAMKLP